jgi:hypothetical protein
VEDATVGRVSVVIWFAARLQCTEHAIRSDVASLHNEELNDLYCSSNILRVIKSTRMRWERHVARVGEGKDVYRILVGKRG